MTDAIAHLESWGEAVDVMMMGSAAATAHVLLNLHITKRILIVKLIYE